MFIFNTDLLLIDVHTWWEVVVVFVTGVVAMFAFASLTRKYWLTIISWWEMGALGLVTFMLLRWDFFESMISLGSKYHWKALGVGLYLAIYWGQKMKLKKEALA